MYFLKKTKHKNDAKLLKIVKYIIYILMILVDALDDILLRLNSILTFFEFLRFWTKSSKTAFLGKIVGTQQKKKNQKVSKSNLDVMEYHPRYLQVSLGCK